MASILLLLLACGSPLDNTVVSTDALGPTIDASGYALAHLAAGDLSGDGQDDLIVGAAGSTSLLILPAPMYNVSGLDDGVAWIGGSEAWDPAWSFSAASDWSGDGLPDLMVGGLIEVEEGESLGEGARLIPGPVQHDFVLESAETQLWLDHEVPDFFAFSVATAPGDLDGDGAADLVICATYMDRVAVFLGPFAGDEQPDLEVTVGGGEFGEVRAVDRPDLDFDGDGHADLLLLSEDDAVAAILPGPLEGDLDIDDASATVVLPFPTVADIDGGDIDGDGVAELVVGSLGSNGLYVFTGPLEGTLALGDTSLVLRGLAGESLGWNVRIGPDRSRDGTPDLLAGTPDITYDRYGNEPTGPGGAYLIGHPLPGEVDDVIRVEGEWGYLGAAAAWVGDTGAFALRDVYGERLFVAP